MACSHRMHTGKKGIYRFAMEYLARRTMVPGGYEAIVDEIIRLRPDFVTLSEVRNYNNTNFTARLTRSLKEKGETYYSFYTYDTGLLSRYPITDSLTVFPETVTTEVFTV